MAKKFPIQLTLAIIKPDLAAAPLSVAEVRRMIVQSGLIVLKTKVDLKVSRSRAELFYQEHRE